MANDEQLAILRQGVEVWNKWREENPKVEIDLSLADLPEANLAGVNLKKANVAGANLKGANLRGASLREANLTGSDLTTANIVKANLKGATLAQAILLGANLADADLKGAYLSRANLSGVDLRGGSLRYADLRKVNFSGANLQGADLRYSNLTKAIVNNAVISKCLVYGTSVWDLEGDFKEQNELIVSSASSRSSRNSAITVDNIEIAQFIFLILNNKKVRDVINTLTSKAVLILGRFALPERKVILDALKNKLREYDLLPIIFDFERPTDRDFTETIKTLAGMCYFVIADVTNPKSSPLELQATVPDYQIPFVPIIQEGEKPFAMMVDLQKKYNWVLKTVTYDSMETLIKVLKPLIIDLAMKKRQELRIIKAQEPEIISSKDFLDKEET